MMSDAGAVTEPPAMQTSASLSPSEPSTPNFTTREPSDRVPKVLQLFDKHRQGGIDRDKRWIGTRLEPEEHVELLHALERDEDLRVYVQDNVQYEYDANRLRLIITMPWPRYQIFLAKVLTEIQIQLRVFAHTSSGTTAEVARHIKTEFSSEVRLEIRADKPSSQFPGPRPDASFRHKADEFSRVVLEVSSSEKRKELPEIADNLILSSDGNIATVIGLDIDYQGTNEGRLSIWRPKFVHEDKQGYLESEEVLSQAFRNSDGTCGSADLNLQLRDFILPLDLDGVSEQDQARSVNIPAAKLTMFLNEAEENSVIRAGKPQTAKKLHLPNGFERRWREPTAPAT